MAHKRADWLHNPCHLGGPQCFIGGANQKWPTCRQIGYISRANASLRGTQSVVTHKWVDWPHNRCHLGSPTLQSKDKIGSGSQVGGLPGWATMAK